MVNIMLTQRELQILKLILNGDANTEDDIAKKLMISKRTVQRSIKPIKDYLHKLDLDLAISGIGSIILTGNENHLKEIKHQLNDSHLYDPTSKEMRRKRLLYLLLKSQEPQKSYYFSQLLDVSNNTLNSDLDSLVSWLSSYSLKLEKQSGKGIYVIGTEYSLINAISAFIIMNIPIEYTPELITEKTADSSIDNVFNLMDSQVYSKVLNTCSSLYQNDSSGKWILTDYMSLLVLLTILIQRKSCTKSFDRDNEQIIESEDSNISWKLIQSLEREFNIRFEKSEVVYICNFIHGLRTDNEDVVSANTKYLELVNKMIDSFSPDIAIILKLDDEFITGLLNHIIPTVARLSNGVVITNPLLKDIKQNYPDTFDRCIQVGRIVEEYTGYRINEDEIGFLTAHFGAELMKLKMNRVYVRKVNIGVICSSGFGISQLLLAKLNASFGTRVNLFPLKLNEYQHQNETSIDFYVTTINLHDDSVDSIFVNPILSEKSIQEIDTKINDYCHIQKSEISTSSLKDIIGISDIVNEMIRGFHVYRYEDNLSFNDIVYRLSGSAVEEKDNAITLEKEILSREKLSSQVLPEFGITLLHCITDAISMPVVIAGAPKEEYKFINPYLGESKLVLMMLAPKGDKQSTKIYTEMLGAISRNIVENKAFLETLKAANEKQIKLMLKEILNEYLSQHSKGINA